MIPDLGRPCAGSEPHAAVACEEWLGGLAVDRHHPDRVSIEPDEEAARQWQALTIEQASGSTMQRQRGHLSGRAA